MSNKRKNNRDLSSPNKKKQQQHQQQLSLAAVSVQQMKKDQQLRDIKADNIRAAWESTANAKHYNPLVHDEDNCPLDQFPKFDIKSGYTGALDWMFQQLCDRVDAMIQAGDTVTEFSIKSKANMSTRVHIPKRVRFTDRALGIIKLMSLIKARDVKEWPLDLNADNQPRTKPFRPNFGPAFEVHGIIGELMSSDGKIRYVLARHPTTTAIIKPMRERQSNKQQNQINYSGRQLPTYPHTGGPVVSGFTYSQPKSGYNATKQANQDNGDNQNEQRRPRNSDTDVLTNAVNSHNQQPSPTVSSVDEEELELDVINVVDWNTNKVLGVYPRYRVFKGSIPELAGWVEAPGAVHTWDKYFLVSDKSASTIEQAQRRVPVSTIPPQVQQPPCTTTTQQLVPNTAQQSVPTNQQQSAPVVTTASNSRNNSSTRPDRPQQQRAPVLTLPNSRTDTEQDADNQLEEDDDLVEAPPTYQKVYRDDLFNHAQGLVNVLEKSNNKTARLLKLANQVKFGNKEDEVKQLGELCVEISLELFEYGKLIPKASYNGPTS